MSLQCRHEVVFCIRLLCPEGFKRLYECLCVDRWKEALDADVAPPVFLDATHAQALEWVSLEDLRHHAATPWA